LTNMDRSLCLFVFLFVGSCFAQFVSYEGQKVLRVEVKSKLQLELLSKALGESRDVWTREGELAVGTNDIRTNITIEKMIKKLGMAYSVMIDDLENLLQEERDFHNNNVTKKQASWFTAYHTYAEIVSYMKSLQATYPNLLQFNPSIGKSIEGRDIPALRITANTDSDPIKIWWNGGQHAREWIGPATVLYITTQLLSLYGEDDDVTKILQECQFDIVPIMNPDGYHHAWTKDRLWRKNRRNNGDGSYGVDLNRNWNEHWGGAGSSGIPSSDTYRGTSAFSEPETNSVSTYISTLDNIIGGIDFHSYSQLVLRPYGWTKANCPDETALKIIGDGVSFSIEEVYSKYYTSQKSIDLYITTGTASDWFYQQGMWAAYTIELRDTGQYGFILPASQIIPTGQEIWNSMMYFTRTVIDTHPQK